MNPWTVLGIEPTQDEKIIKKAYAELLKQYHPEEDPDGFQRLRMAYDSIRKQQTARVRMMQRETEAKGLNGAQEALVENMYRSKNDDLSATAVSAEPELSVVFMQQVKNLWNDKEARIEPQEWTKILDDEKYWDVAQRMKMSWQLLGFLQRKWKKEQHCLPAAVWKVLDEHFSWSEQNLRLQYQYSDEFLEFIMMQSGRLIVKQTLTRRKNRWIKRDKWWIWPAIWLCYNLITHINR